jgi:hypothetical protein
LSLICLIVKNCENHLLVLDTKCAKLTFNFEK